MTGRLYFGDNLHVLREYVKDESVDLIYLDPPFNSKASYNVLFRNPSGTKSQAQIRAFEDTWHWGPEAAVAYEDVLASGSPAAGILRALRTFLGENDVMAYLAMMAVRVLELHRVLKPAGSLYLHCDPTASHYLKVLLDGVFSVKNYRSEIIWKRSTSHGNVGRNYGALSDTIFFYTKSDTYTWNQQYAGYSPEYERRYSMQDAGGRRWQSVSLRNPSVRPNLQYPYPASNGVIYQPHPNGWAVGLERMKKYDAEARLHFPTKPGGQLRLKQYLDEQKGTRLQNIWDDIPAVNSQAHERLGYPTQKPLSLLERIILTSSHEGDVVLDPFCGCGTAIHAAQKLRRRWSGIDVTHIAIQIVEDRLRRHFPTAKFDVHGRPTDLSGAIELANRDKYQFQWWATWLAGGMPRGGERKGADRGVDGEMYFKLSAREDGKAIISVKGGQSVNPSMVRDLSGTVQAENAEMGIFVTLTEPTAEMKKAASAAGFWEGPQGRYMKIQIKTIKELLDGRRPETPPLYSTVTAAEAGRQTANRNLRQHAKPDRRQKHLLLPLIGQSPGQPKAKKNLVLNLEATVAPRSRRTAK